MHKSNRTTRLLIALALTAIVVGMTWRSLHPTSKQLTFDGSMLVSGYLVEDTAAIDLTPDDSLPVNVFAGTLRNGTFTPAAMKPATFAQRQVNLIFRFEDMPKDPAPTIEKIRQAVNAWDKVGNQMVALFFDYRPAKPDIPAYVAFIKAFRAKEGILPYHAVPLVNPNWLAPKLTGAMGPEARFVIVELKSKTLPTEVVQADRSGSGFQLLFPKGVGINDIDTSALRKHPAFGGVILTIDPKAPPLKTEKTISLFPKLF